MSSINKYNIQDIQKEVLTPYQKHRQLSMKEAQSISLDILTLLCDAQISDEDTLKWLARLMTPETYMDLMDERNLNKLCGYPMCQHPPERERDPFSMSETTKKFLWENNPYAYLSRFCSKFHFRCSQFYQVQLSEDALFSRTGIHLINDTLQTDNSINEKYGIELMEVLLRNKATEEEIKNIVLGVNKLDLATGDTEYTEESRNGEIRNVTSPEDLSQWLQDFKIIENDKPSIIDDYLKDR
ncbi:RNA polymerase II subunit B1 CTD phosphatase Rtr1p [Monosporozyma servazzii]